MLFNYDGVISAYDSLFFCVLYVYSLKFPEIKFSIVGAFQIRMEWFFWLFLLLNASRDNIVDLLIGIFSGGVYLGLKESSAIKTGIIWLKTPDVLFDNQS